MPFWGCLDCENAVFSPTKLPAILDFRDFVLAARAKMSAEDWALKFRSAYARIVEEILPAFPKGDLEEAERSRSIEPSFYVPYGTVQ